MTAKFWVGGTGTWDNATTTHWALTTGGAGGAAVPVTGDAVTFDASSGAGTCTVDATVSGLSLASITCGAMGMTLDFSVNNPNLTLTANPGFSISGTGTRTIKLGSGTFTFTASSGNFWDAGTVTNLTLNAGTSNIVSQPANPTNTRTFVAGAGLTYATVTLGNNNGINNGNLQININGASTITTLNISAPAQISFLSNFTVTNALNASGAAFNNVITYISPTGIRTITLTGGGTMSWVAIEGLTFTGSPTATNSFDLGATSGITITGPAGSSGSHMIGG